MKSERNTGTDAAERLDLSAFAVLAKSAAETAPSEADVVASLSRLGGQSREVRLEESGLHRSDPGARGAITHDDVQAIIADRLRNTHALQTCKRWVKSRDPADHGHGNAPRIMALTGLTGRGKTLAGAWLIAALGGRYVTAEALRRASLSTHWRDSGVLDLLQSTRCVVVDDAGTEEAAGSEAAMFNFVNKRAGDARAWTLITANITTEEFASRYGERTIRRIEHNGVIVEVTGDDLRRKPAAPRAAGGF